MAYTSGDHYTDLQPFYKQLSSGAAIHLPLWLPKVETPEQANRAALQLMADRARPKQGSYILDAGCGLGTAAVWIAETFGARVLGVSNSEANIRHCSEIARSRGVANLVEFRVADLMQEFERENVFDGIWSLESLNYLCPKATFIRSAYRMLKPGGTWLCMDRFLDFHRYAPDISSRLKRPLTTGFYTPEHWEGAMDLLAEARAAGFIEDSYLDLTDAVLDLPRRRRAKPIDMNRALLASLSHPRSYLSLYRGFRVIRSSYQLMQKGMMTYGLFTASKPA